MHRTGLCLKSMARRQESTRIEQVDWTDCPLVEVVPGKVNGVPILKGTRMPADGIVSNFQTGSPVKEISENFDIPEQTIWAILAYAVRHTDPYLKGNKSV